jgi:uncharacterized protein
VILPDVNVLVNAFRRDAPEHDRCRAWLEDVVNGEARFGMSPQVMAAVIRVATHSKVFKQPSALDEALAFADVLLHHPAVLMIQPGDTHGGIFTRLCRQAATTGNLVPDAWFAALAIESGCQWITLDRDYSRFEGLKWTTPG